MARLFLPAPTLVAVHIGTAAVEVGGKLVAEVAAGRKTDEFKVAGPNAYDLVPTRAFPFSSFTGPPAACTAGNSPMAA